MSEVLRLRSPALEEIQGSDPVTSQAASHGGRWGAGKPHAVHGILLLLSLHRRSLVSNLEAAKSLSARS